jgi:hypothetical protein
MDNFEQVIGRLFVAHARLKAIDRKVLSEKRRKERAEQMGALRRSIDQLVLVQFGQLAAAGQASALDLDRATLDLATALNGIKKAIGTLDAIGAALGTITSLVKLVRGV